MKLVLYFDVSAIVLLLIMFISNFTRKLTSGRTNRLFMCIIVMTLIATVGDFISGYGSNYLYPSTTNIVLVYLANYVYFLVFTDIPIVFFLYCFSSMGIWNRIKEKKLVLVILVVVTIINNIVILSNIITHKVFYVTSFCIYHRGSYLSVCYILFALVMLQGIAVIVKYRKCVSSEKFIVLIGILPVNCIAILIQHFNPNLLVEMFMITMEITLLLIVVQRQESYVDPISGAKKYSTGAEIVKKNLYLKNPMVLILSKIANNKNVRMSIGQKKYDEFLNNVSKDITGILKAEKMNYDVYYLGYGLYGMIGEGHITEEVKKCANHISDYLRKEIPEKYDMIISGMTCIVECPTDIDDYNTLISFTLEMHNLNIGNREAALYKDILRKEDYIIQGNIDKDVRSGKIKEKIKPIFRPIYSTKEKRISGVEISLYMEDDMHSAVSYDHLMELVEKAGYSQEFWQYLMEYASDFIANDYLAKFNLNFVRLKIKQSQCMNSKLVQMTKDIISKYEISAENIVVEISDVVSDSNIDVLDNNVAGLCKLGINMMIDNFGAGYCDLMRVAKLPIINVELTEYFVDHMDSPETRIVLSDTVAMLGAINKLISCEASEKRSENELLEEIGVDYIVGCVYENAPIYCNYLDLDGLKQRICEKTA